METTNETTEAEVAEETEETGEEEVETEAEETEEQSEEETTTEATETKPEPKPKGNSRKEETPQEKDARLSRQLAQHRKKHGIAEGKTEAGSDGDRMDRVELRQEGITDKKQQDAVIDYARYKKIDVLAALATPSVKAEIKALQAKSATPPPSSRSGSGKGDDVAHWARQLTVYGKPAPTAELRKKVLEHLAKGNQ